jgi:indole-3-glycerol phosphate synthase
MSKAQAIADFNRQHFFSKKFQNQVINELQNNLMTALTEVETTNTSKRFLDWRKIQAMNIDIRNIMKISNTDRTRQDLANVIKTARQYYLRSKRIGEIINKPKKD